MQYGKGHHKLKNKRALTCRHNLPRGIQLRPACSFLKCVETVKGWRRSVNRELKDTEKQILVFKRETEEAKLDNNNYYCVIELTKQFRR